MTKNDQFEDIYIYVNKQGRLTEVPAFISKSKPMKLAFAIPAIDRDNFHFLREVAKEPGMIFNDSVWFKKPNFKKAKSMFMVDYGERLGKAYSEIETIKDQMSYLEKQEEV